MRGTRYLEGLNRATELVTRPLGAAMVAFVAEALPGSLMRGVPAADLAAAGLDETSARAHADANTTARFSSLPERIRAAARIPADGWRLGSDILFQGSVLLVEDVLAAFAERSGGDVLLAVPDRAEVLALPAGLPTADRFRMRVLRAWREAPNPVSHGILVTDGARWSSWDAWPAGTDSSCWAGSAAGRGRQGGSGAGRGPAARGSRQRRDRPGGGQPALLLALRRQGRGGGHRGGPHQRHAQARHGSPGGAGESRRGERRAPHPARP